MFDMETGSDPFSFPPFYLFANRKACSMLVENIYPLPMPRCMMVNTSMLSQAYAALMSNRWDALLASLGLLWLKLYFSF